MTTTEFLRLIEKVRDQFEWTLSPDTGREPERRSTPRLHLLASPKRKAGMRLDPMRAAVYARSGEAPDTWMEAAILLGMELTDANALAAAASDRTWTGVDGGRGPAIHRQQIRDRLLDAVGLRPGAREVWPEVPVEVGSDQV